MRIIKKETYEELSRCAADMILAAVREKPECVLGLATGSTPIGTYDCLAAACREGKATFRQAKTINLDEYTGLGENDPQSYRFLWKSTCSGTLISDGRTPISQTGWRRMPRKNANDMRRCTSGSAELTFNCSVLAKTGILGSMSRPVRWRPERMWWSSAKARALQTAGILRAFPPCRTARLHLAWAASLKQGAFCCLHPANRKRSVAQGGSRKSRSGSACELLQLHPDVTVICDFSLTL